MNAHAEVTVICATRNAREAVRLTFSSFHRYTPERCTVLVADNGSTDGALDVLRRFPWIKVFSLRERRALVRAQSMQSHQAIAALNARLDRSVGSLPGTERALLISALTTQVHELDILPESNGQGASTGHGVTLDWLAEKVTTPFLLTLDSDVEFLATGWLREMLNLLKRASLTALGEYEPGVCGYRSRLAPHLLLLRTSALHTHHWSFRGFVSIEDPDEAKRWRARPKSPNLDAEEAATYRSAAFYSTGAWLFESLVRTGERWMAIPESITHKFRHLRHASWAPYVAKGTSGARKLRAANKARQTYIQQRLRLY